MTWDYSIFCAVDGCENVARHWPDLTDEQKDSARRDFADACLCAEHRELECGIWEYKEFRCTRQRGHDGPHRGNSFDWAGRELRMEWV